MHSLALELHGMVPGLVPGGQEAWGAWCGRVAWVPVRDDAWLPDCLDASLGGCLTAKFTACKGAPGCQPGWVPGLGVPEIDNRHN
jgi:hypothetical protein